ncbi:hypothetical protein thalar_00506 [Litoreibacter arenae DSM 19593]|uniref:Uncharacterized protein n=1 Tax=Litoreibacter arenae DSM 19593 TaxID=1123360 RepID=S9RSM8_9RHOB|nr:hypothetical protein thalar_00506 [Litoreibacter arenae DSM 19593]
MSITCRFVSNSGDVAISPRQGLDRKKVIFWRIVFELRTIKTDS